jgi:hypothetical protein
MNISISVLVGSRLLTSLDQTDDPDSRFQAYFWIDDGARMDAGGESWPFAWPS